jgi:hypothetical protein
MAVEIRIRDNSLLCHAAGKPQRAGGHDTQTDPPNLQTIPVEVDTFFGCWLDINQPQQSFLPSAPPPGNPDGPWTGITLNSLNQVITRAPHQCLVAEMMTRRYLSARTPETPTSWHNATSPGSTSGRFNR